MKRSLSLFRQEPLKLRIILVLCYFAVLSLMLLGYTQIAEAKTSGKAAAHQVPASAFYRLPQYTHPQISPSGHYLASRVTTNGKSDLLVSPISSDAEPFLMDSGERWSLSKTLWVSDHELLVSFSRPKTDGGMRFLIGRTVLLDTKTRKARMLFKRQRNAGFAQFQDAILGRAPGQPGTFYLEASKSSNQTFPAVYAVSGTPQRLPARPVQSSQKGVLGWEIDRRGSVRVGHGFTRDQQRGVLKLKDAGGNWHDVSGLLDREARVLAKPTKNPNRYYILMLPQSQQATDDRGLRHVYEYDVASGEETVLFAANTSEVATVLMDPKGEEVVMVRYQDESEAPLIFDPQLEEIHATLKEAFPDAWVGLQSTTDDLSQAVFSVSSPLNPGALYLYDAAKRELAAFRQQYPGLNASNLADVYSVAYSARDGTEIPAYLTLPRGLRPDTARSLPFVVLPHGGPHARDFRRFDWMAQMLANAGYGVLQMNFRGSTGYGVAFEKAGRNQWSGVMTNDVIDGAEWLASNGLADASRLCVVGASFGGFASMMSVAKAPALFQCAVSLNGVSDLYAFVAEVRRYIGGTFLTRHIGRVSDRKYLRENSPLKQSVHVEVPVLLVVSNRDRVVNPSQTRRLYKALKKNGAEVRLLDLPQGDHYLSRQANRKTFAEALLAFLAQNLPEPMPQMAKGES